MGCVSCHSHGELDEEFLRERVEEVMEKLEGEEDIPFSVVAVDGPEQCDEVVEELEVEDVEGFLETCRGARTSVSFESGGQEFIVIRVHGFVREDAAALRGLLAHELMHTVQRADEKGKVEDAAKKYEEEMIGKLKDAGLSDDEAERFIYTVFRASILAVKDLLTNRQLIEQGFAGDLEAYYHHVLGIDEFCPVPDFYGEEAELEEVQDAIEFELGLLPAWLPFKALDREKSNRIRRRLEECYEQDIPEVARYMHSLEDLYQEEAGSEDFVEEFLRQVVERAVHVMEGKTSTG